MSDKKKSQKRWQKDKSSSFSSARFKFFYVEHAL